MCTVIALIVIAIGCQSNWIDKFPCSVTAIGCQSNWIDKFPTGLTSFRARWLIYGRGSHFFPRPSPFFLLGHERPVNFSDPHRAKKSGFGLTGFFITSKRAWFLRVCQARVPFSESLKLHGSNGINRHECQLSLRFLRYPIYKHNKIILPPSTVANKEDQQRQ